MSHTDKGYTRERVCADCGRIDAIRKDSKATRCINCAGRANQKYANAILAQKKNTEICVQCGGVFYSPKSNHKKHCSPACLEKTRVGLKVKKICKQCGKAFSIYASLLKTNATGNFCTRGCYEEWMSDADYTSGRGSRWKRISRDVIKATPFCVLCGATSRLEVHHIAPYRLTMDNSKENLIPLCKKCHTQFEYMTRDVIRAGCTDEHIKLILGNILETYKLAHLACLRSIND